MTLEDFSWLLKDSLAGMRHPGEWRGTFARLKEMGIGAVVSLTPVPLPRRLLYEHDMAYLHLPIENFEAPELRQIRRFVEFCNENIGSGRPVMVHCLAGLGRTGTMLACYLVSEGMLPAAAIRHVRAYRPGSIETAEQEQVIFDFAAHASAERQNPERNGRQ
jgi:atypical dual specificity phosphatase